jgi:hypothetical protein
MFRNSLTIISQGPDPTNTAYTVSRAENVLKILPRE